MTLTSIAAVVALAATAVHADQLDNGKLYDLKVYVVTEGLLPAKVLTFAEGTASKIFEGVGVRVKWCHGKPPEGQALREQAMVVRVIIDSQGQQEGGAMASALPYEGSAIAIVYSRMKWAENSPILAPKLFAHVLVHEITHNLQGIKRHSETGIMKARWGVDDYSEMVRKRLAFEPVDIQLIHLGLKVRSERFNENTALSSRP